MKEVRNPFLLQTAESIDSDSDFLRLFGHRVLDLLPDDALTGRPLFIRSAPGGGKTSLLKLFTPSVLQNLVVMKANEATKDLFSKLKALGAVSDQGVRVLSVMLSSARTFPALVDVGLNATRAKRLLLALIDSRILLGALRSILVVRGLRFPDDLSRLSLVAPPNDVVPGLSFPADGVAVQQWAESVEQRVAELIDTLLSTEGSGPSGHDALLSLHLLDANCVRLDGKPFETHWLIMFDDMQKLAPSQRTDLLQVVVEQRSRSTVWLAERFAFILLEDLEPLSSAQFSEARRLTWLIDIFYDHRVRLAVSARTDPSLLYPQGPLSGEFERTVSRLTEMRTERYLRLGHRASLSQF